MANRRQSRRRQSRRNRKQYGGSPSVAYTGDTIMAAGGAPFEVRTAQDPHCAGPDSFRAGMMGGRRSRRQRQSQRRQRNQRGGGCGCMGLQRGGGSGNGGYSVMLGQNENIGYPLAYVKGACPPMQMGGDPKQLINSYQTGYGLTQPVNTDSANYMDYQSYGRNCMGGGRRRKSKSRR